ncbi:DUF3821 domain-containing protein [Methanospirillum sp.]
MKKIGIFLVFFFVFTGLFYPVTGMINKVPAGGQIFIGESGLDISIAIQDSTHIAHWSEDSSPDIDEPDYIHTISNSKSFFVHPTIYVGKEGKWYQWHDNTKGPLAFDILEPQLDLKIWDGTDDKDITDGDVKIGNYVNFLIETNMGSIITRPGYQPGDAPFRIKILDENWVKYYDHLKGKNGKENSLINLGVNKESWYWISPDNQHDSPTSGDGWNTAALNNFGESLYEPILYAVWVECNANGMKDNYLTPDGLEYNWKTVSPIRSITLTTTDDKKTLSGTNYDLKEKEEDVSDNGWYRNNVFVEKHQYGVQDGDLLAVDYVGTLSDGTEFDSSREISPFLMVLGSGKALPGFDYNLQGMKIGESKKFTLSPQEAYGEYDSAKIVSKPIDFIPQGENAMIGDRVTLFDGNQEFQVTILYMDEKTVIFDLNSPLAGKYVTFDVIVRDIIPAWIS